jgi:uncharacterized protein with HEPN domain
VRDPKERLRDVLEAVAALERYHDRDRQSFERDELLQAWFLRNLQIIGEAVRALPEDVRKLAPEIPWAEVIGMRNVLVHGYFDIDTEAVWAAATRDAPALKPAVEKLLKLLEKKDRK